MIQYLKSRHLTRYLPMLASSLVLAACVVNPADAQSLTPARTAQVRHACATTMGLNPANADYDMCVARLQRTMARIDQAALVERDRGACMQRGLQPDTRQFALCVVDAEQVASN
jgi:hypothetical protein